MSGNFYNLIMATVPEFYSGDAGEFTIPKDRFLQYTEDHIKDEFESLDEDAIAKLKALPTIFATENEVTDARIGKITDIKVSAHAVKAKYKFDGDRYPLTSGVLQENWQKLGISESNFEFHRGHWGVKECDLDDFYEEYLKSLTGIAHQLKDADKKVQLIYAFNGTGKTRLSRILRNLIAPKSDNENEEDVPFDKFLYYNAFTEDLFRWDNDLEFDAEPKLKIYPNRFTNWLLKDQGLDERIVKYFQIFTDSSVMPVFNPPDEKGERSVSFSLGRTGLDNNVIMKDGAILDTGEIVKISKGEESNFIWSIFYTLLDEVIDVLNISEIEDRDTDQFNKLEYIFIDDPVSSLDENHLIELAVRLAARIKDAPKNLKFVITTHNPLFYNVLYSQLKLKNGYILSKSKKEVYHLEGKDGAANKAFSYHLHIKNLIEQAIKKNTAQRYHFTLLRNLYEKTAAFLGYRDWADLLDTVEGNKKSYIALMNSLSHSKLSNEEITELTPPQQQTVKLLLDNLDQYGSWYKED